MARSSGAEPTEAPTPKRLLEARRHGQVAVGRDLSSALGLVALVVVLAGGAEAAIARLAWLFHTVLSASMKDPIGLGLLAGRGFDVAVALSLAPLCAVLAVGALATVAQTKGLFAWRAFAPDGARLSPARGLARLFSGRTLGEVVKRLSFIAVIVAVAALALAPAARNLPRLVGAGPASILAALGVWSKALGLRVALALGALGAIDAILAQARHRRTLKMTREEVKRERKEMEGDPLHKAERQRLYRELAEPSSPALVVQRADFVVLDAESLAVAVGYDRAANRAPLVLVKGERDRAEPIKHAARVAGIPICRDFELARALNDVPEGEEIPEALFQAVAELLTTLWATDRRAERSTTGTTEAGPSPGDANSSATA